MRPNDWLPAYVAIGAAWIAIIVTCVGILLGWWR